MFVDEAYAEFSGRTFIPELPAFPNVIVGRTFSKAFGLAGLRIGAWSAAATRSTRSGSRFPVYSVNIAAVVAVQAALDDLGYVQDYLRQVNESKALLYAACDRLGPEVLEERRELRARARRRPRRRGGRRRARARHLPSRSIDRTRLRRLRAHRRRARRAHPARHRGRWKRSCAPRGNRSPDDGNAIALTIELDGKGRTTCGPASAFSITCWSCSRGTAPSI